MKILALSGSLRKASSNTALLKASSKIFPQITLYPHLGNLPLFNPDLDENKPSPVLHFIKEIVSSDGIIIASPEYAHGVTGVIKNALDWIVSSEEFVQKPVALLNASARSKHAYDSLKEIVNTMNGHLIHEACTVIPLPNNKITTEEILADENLSKILKNTLEIFINKILNFSSKNIGMSYKVKE